MEIEKCLKTTPVTLNLSTVWLKTHQVITVFHCILSNTLAGIAILANCGGTDSCLIVAIARAHQLLGTMN